MPQKSQPSTPKPRIQGLSDMIFGLALSIGALTLIGRQTTDSSEIQANILAFAFSFLILISIWLRYTSIMSVLPVETATGTILNVIMLFCVSLEPYLFNLLGSVNGYSGFSSAAYAVDLGVLFAILALLTHQLTIEERNLIPLRLIRKYRATRNGELLTAGVFLLSAAPPFGSYPTTGPTVRVWLWFVPFVILIVRRLQERRADTHERKHPVEISLDISRNP